MTLPSLSNPTADAAPWRRCIDGQIRLSHLHAILPVAAVLAPLAILAVVGWEGWRSVWEVAEAETSRAAASAAEYGKRTLESYSVAAGRLNDRLRGLSDGQIRADESRLHHEIKRMGAELTQSDVAYVIDRDGYALLASNFYPAQRQVSLADRDYFQALAGPALPTVYVSRTFLGRFDGRLLFSVARRREETGNPPSADGFDGVVVVSVSPNVLADGLRRLLPSPQDRMALMRADGWGVASTSGVSDREEPLPQVDPSSPFHIHAANGVESAVYVTRTAMPGSEALLAMRRIEGFPIYAVSIRPRAEIVAGWWAVMAPQFAFGLAATLGLLLLSLRVARDQRRLAASNADLQRDNELGSDRLYRARRFGLVGTFEFDLRTGISWRSPEYMAVHGLPAVATKEGHDDWANRLHPDDRERADAELSRALSEASAETDYGQTYRIIIPSGEIRWIAARGQIARDERGRAVMLLGAHVDVTPLRNTEIALAESDARLRLAQEAAGIGVWEWLWATRSLKLSPKMTEICGFDPARDAPGLSEALSRVHPDDLLNVRAFIRQVKRAGGFSGEFRILRPGADGAVETVWVATRAKLVPSTRISHSRLMGVAYDVTERKRAEEVTTLMAQEVEHRAKNVLAVVSSLLRITKAETAEQLAQVMDSRISALGRTMTLLGRGRWQGADLRDIFRNELEPYDRSPSGDNSVIEIAGPPVAIGVDAAQPLAMALHELATNAAKYGALSTPSGRLKVTWRVDGDMAHLLWEERGGPEVRDPSSKLGFGSRLIRILFDQLRGDVTKRWEPTGLVCEMSIPLRPQK